MSRRLRDAINAFITRNGSDGKKRLCQVVDRSERTLDRWLDGEIVPDSHSAYKLARECGFEDKEALLLAQGASSEARDEAS